MNYRHVLLAGAMLAFWGTDDYARAAQLSFEPQDNEIYHGTGIGADEYTPALENATSTTTPIASPLILTQFGGFSSVRPHRLSFYQNALDAAHSDGRMPVWSLDFREYDIVILREFIYTEWWDDVIDAYADMVRDLGYPIVIRLGIEYNLFYGAEEAANYGIPEETFKLAYRKVVDRFRSRGVENVSYMWCYSPFLDSSPDFKARIGDDWLWYPGDDYVDWYSADLFFRGSFDPSTSFTEFLGGNHTSKGLTYELCRFALEHGKPVAMAESSAAKVNITPHPSAEPTYWNAWFQPFLNFHNHDFDPASGVTHNPVKGFSYFEKDWGNVPPTDWGNAKITSNTLLLAHWADAMAGTLSPPPSPTPRTYLHKAAGLAAKPVAHIAFTATAAGGVPLTVQFKDISANQPTGWSWDFGDSATSSAQDPAHTYTNAGTYTVKLTASKSGDSDEEIKTNYIVVRGTNQDWLASSGFSGTQDQNQWSYWEWAPGAGSAVKMTNYDSTYHVWFGTEANCFVGNVFQSPTTYASLRAWQAPQAGTVRATGTVQKVVTGGAGVYVMVLKNSDEILWGPKLLEADDTTTTLAHDMTVDVNANDYIAFMAWQQESGPESAVWWNPNVNLAAGITPRADFTWDVSEGVSPLLVTFKDKSTGKPTTWQWDFDNNGSVNTTASSPADQSFTYTNTTGADKNFTPRLVVSNSQGSSTLIPLGAITVHPQTQPSAGFIAKPAVAAPGATVSFEDRSRGEPTGWEWNFGDGSALSNAKNPTHGYSSAGTYTVSLKVSKSGFSDNTASDKVVIASSPSYQEDFTDFSDWALNVDWPFAVKPTKNSLWRSDTQSSHSGPQSARYALLSGTYDTTTTTLSGTIHTRNYGNLVSPSILVGHASQLSFWQWKETETANAQESYDQCSVFVMRNDKQASPIRVALKDSMDANFSNWTEQTADLSEFEGRTVRLVFRFETHDGEQNAFGGWGVDDVAITNAVKKP